MYYIVGLGNPGEKYEKTRHNVGRAFLQSLAVEAGFGAWEKSKHANAQYVHGTIAGETVEFILPETFMNKSGDTVRYVVEKHGATPEQFIVVHDEVDLALGEMKISQGRGAGGNNGIESIIKSLGSKDFIRVRIGISPTSFWTGKTKRPAGGKQLESFVLKPFTSGERAKLEAVQPKVAKALAAIVSEGVETAMNECN